MQNTVLNDCIIGNTHKDLRIFSPETDSAGKKHRFILFFFFSLLTCLNIINCQVDYRKEFGSGWLKAEAFINENEPWIKPVLDKYGIDYTVAMAVVFPELIRYSILRDKIEITLLKALYVNIGEHYADFSIGPFQMKPSFAGRILEALSNTREEMPEIIPDINRGNTDSWKYRASIVKDLENIRIQVLYLASFLKICEAGIKPLTQDENEKVAFLAASYNAGFWKTRQEITAIRQRKDFTTRIAGPPYYNYSDIAVYWFKLKRAKDQ